jgi:hypothetical protein
MFDCLTDALAQSEQLSELTLVSTALNFKSVLPLIARRRRALEVSAAVSSTPTKAKTLGSNAAAMSKAASASTDENSVTEDDTQKDSTGLQSDLTRLFADANLRNKCTDFAVVVRDSVDDDVASKPVTTVTFPCHKTFLARSSVWKVNGLFKCVCGLIAKNLSDINTIIVS